MTKKLLVLVLVLIPIFLILPKFLSYKDNINVFNLAGEYQLEETEAVFNNKTVEVPQVLLAEKVLGETTEIKETTEDEKVIKIDLTGQRLFMYEGDEVIDYFIISSGKWGRTPTGEFRIWSKFKYTKMSGGSRALRTYYYLPNVPYTMFFYNDEIPMHRGYGIHGTYWHDNFGVPMSHGCINMKTEDAKTVFEWAKPEVEEDKNSIRASREDPGTKVIIFGKAQMW
jgi:lipoprotein-anchoring transpeptidase ErfK/SrfK